jgi:ribonuclease PH
MDLSVAGASSSAGLPTRFVSEYYLIQFYPLDGSASVSQGLTAVSASVFGPREAKNRRDTIHDRATLNVQIVMAPFASSTSRRRRGKNDKYVLSSLGGCLLG